MPLVTVDRVYEYEVAFSFLQEDEALAYQIKDNIHDRYSAFIYSQHQKELVGKDGTESFRQVFEEKARIVVVLYRENWGTTFWTRVEEEAIKRRAYEESADFTIFVSLDGKKPTWLSKTQIWYDFDRFGIKPLAAIIEKRIVEYGGHIREESIIDQATRQKRKISYQKELEEYLLSKDGYADGIKEVVFLLTLAESNINKISELGLSFGTSNKPNQYFTTYGLKIGLTFKWKLRYRDSLAESTLEVFIADGDYYNSNPTRPGNIFYKEEYVFYKNEAGTLGWVLQVSKTDFKTTESLVNFWQKQFLDQDQIDKEKDGYKRY